MRKNGFRFDEKVPDTWFHFGEDHRIPDDLIKNHPNVIAAKQKIVEALAKINGNMTYVFVEGPSFCTAWTCPKLEITALYRPIHPESSYKTKTMELGFVDR